MKIWRYVNWYNIDWTISCELMRLKTAVNLDFVDLDLTINVYNKSQWSAPPDFSAVLILHTALLCKWFLYLLNSYISDLLLGLQLNVSESVVNEILKHWTCILDENITTKDNWIVMQNIDIIINL